MLSSRLAAQRKVPPGAKTSNDWPSADVPRDVSVRASRRNQSPLASRSKYRINEREH